LIVEDIQFDARGEAWPERIDLFVHQVRDFHGVTVGCRLTLIRTAGFPFAVTTVYAGAEDAVTAPTSRTRNRSIVDILDDHAADFIGAVDLGNRSGLKTIGGCGSKVPVNPRCSCDLAASRMSCHRNMSAQHLRGNPASLEIRLLSPLHQDSCNAIEPVQTGFDIVGRNFPQLCLRDFVEVRL